MLHVNPEEREQFLKQINAPHEAIEKLDRYAALLVEWNQKFNLVSESTLPHVWQRHFLDSAQLMRHIPANTQTIVDIGSGAGFPGLVLSILGAPRIRLVESVQKKITFLQAVIDELKLDAVLHHDRVENLKDLKADLITARAVSSIFDILSLTRPIAKHGTVYLLLKGKKAADEIAEAKKNWTFSCDTNSSLSDDSGSILVLKNTAWKSKKLRH